MRYILLLIVLIPAAMQAQVKISGKVESMKKPVKGASIAIRDSYDGATSDSLGRFSFTTTEEGEVTVVVTNVGYKPYEQVVKIEGNPIELDIQLKEEITELTAVVVKAGYIRDTDRQG